MQLTGLVGRWLAALTRSLWRPQLNASTLGGRAQGVSPVIYVTSLTKAEFYKGKTVHKVLWYLHDCDLPEKLQWARLRVFDDGSADATFSVDGPAYGFVEQCYAGYILTEDEYVCFSEFDDEDDASYGTDRRRIAVPSWVDPVDKPFEFLGRY